MEENKKVTEKSTKKSTKETTQDKKENRAVKLSYEELENAARQISAQLDAVLKENSQLKSAVNQLQMNNLYTELNFRFKVVEFQDSFSPTFVDNCINTIESIMTTKDSDEAIQEGIED